MIIKKLHGDFTVCKVKDYSQVNFESEYCFLGKTDSEHSLVCFTKDTPTNTIDREDGWCAFRMEGILDFSLVGILAKIAVLLAEEEISIFAVSTFNTDYIFLKKESELKALKKLAKAGYHISTN